MKVPKGSGGVKLTIQKKTGTGLEREKQLGGCSQYSKGAVHQLDISTLLEMN